MKHLIIVTKRFEDHPEDLHFLMAPRATSFDTLHPSGVERMTTVTSLTTTLYCYGNDYDREAGLWRERVAGIESDIRDQLNGLDESADSILVACHSDRDVLSKIPDVVESFATELWQYRPFTHFPEGVVKKTPSTRYKAMCDLLANLGSSQEIVYAEQVWLSFGISWK